MPTYEYRCPKGHEFEKFQRMSEPPEAECPECGRKAERVLSGGAGLLFKGGGFYITDYRSDSYRKAAEKDRGAESGSSSGKGEGKGEGKAEPKGEGKSTGEAKSKAEKGKGKGKAEG